MRAKKIDNNQNDIVDDLRDIPGVTVEPNHDDILVGYKGETYWFEIKADTPFKKDGNFKKDALRPHQVDLYYGWQGHYKVVWTLEQILGEIGVDLC